MLPRYYSATTMASGRVAAAGVLLLLFLLTCCALAVQQASTEAAVQPTAKRSPPSPRIRKCTHAQKVNILHACWRWVKLDHGHRVLPPHNEVYDLCCNALRDVRARRGEGMTSAGSGASNAYVCLLHLVRLLFVCHVGNFVSQTL